MKATGIVRRMDDLGRVVIPKELRRSMKIREGSPLEIYTHNGAVCFKPYDPVGERNWNIAKNIATTLLDCGFALLDYSGEVQALHNPEGEILGKYVKILVDGCEVGTLEVSEDVDKHALERTVAVLKSLLNDAE